MLKLPNVNGVRSVTVIAVPNSICVSGATVDGWPIWVEILITWLWSTYILYGLLFSGEGHGRIRLFDGFGLLSGSGRGMWLRLFDF